MTYFPQIGHIELAIFCTRTEGFSFSISSGMGAKDGNFLFRGKECKTPSKEAKKSINEKSSRNQAKQKKVHWPQNGKLV